MVRITREPIDHTALMEMVRRPSCGAVVAFLGTVRDLTGDLRTDALEYEAYPQMAERQMAEIERLARAQWPCGDVVQVHRLGLLHVGETSVAVAVSAPHRADAFAACQFVIDRLKEVVPIWKKDIGPNSAQWVHPESERKG